MGGGRRRVLTGERGESGEGAGLGDGIGGENRNGGMGSGITRKGNVVMMKCGWMERHCGAWRDE